MPGKKIILTARQDSWVPGGTDPVFTAYGVLSVNMAGALEDSLGDSVLCCSVIWSLSSVFSLSQGYRRGVQGQGKPLEESGRL